MKAAKRACGAWRRAPVGLAKGIAALDPMSFDIYLAIAAPGIPTTDLRRLFGLSEPASPDSETRWPLEDCELFLSKGDDGRVVHISVNRPTGLERLWNGLFGVLLRGDSVFYFASDPLCAVVAERAAVTRMPEDMQTSFGDVLVVESAEALGRSIYR